MMFAATHVGHAFDWKLTVAIAGAGIAGVSALFFWWTAHETRKANVIPALLDFLREYREYEPARRYVIRDLQADYDPKDRPFPISEMKSRARKPIVDVVHYLDHLGLLVNERLIKVEDMAGYMGQSVRTLWDVLSPFIQAERTYRSYCEQAYASDRELRDNDYALYFEDLAVRVAMVGPESVRVRIRRRIRNARKHPAARAAVSDYVRDLRMAGRLRHQSRRALRKPY
jgi:hypothetical protein